MAIILYIKCTNYIYSLIAEPSIDLDENISRVADDTTINVDAQGPVKFSVWVSFAEIYNETIYDLLEPCPPGKGKKRTTLRLGDDTNGNPYIKGRFTHFLRGFIMLLGGGQLVFVGGQNVLN